MMTRPPKPLCLLCLLFLAASALAEEPLWTWVGGNKAQKYHGVYVTQGEELPGIHPGFRQAAATWTDSSGRLWLFGGRGPITPTGNGYRHDLWRYDPATGCWIWVKGSAQPNQQGIYGTKGVAAATNNPGSRYGASTWSDAQGRLWLFGGVGLDESSSQYYILNDLWRFDPATNQWTWIKGSKNGNQPGVYGTRGTAHTANTPGARASAQSWVDAAGKLWLFGGMGVDAHNAGGMLNDLWRFDPATENWTWVKGSDLKDHPGNYGTQGQSDPANLPRGREQAVAWTGKDGRFWLFGGYNMANRLNDLWCFDPATGNWVWVKGSNSVNQFGTYGTRGTPAAANTPGARSSSKGWVDSAGRLWLYGGDGLGQSYAYVRGQSDLWRFDPATGNWTWVKGPADTPNEDDCRFGTQGIAVPANTPGTRFGSVAWTDRPGKCWLYSGTGRQGTHEWGQLIDLWSFDSATENWTWVAGDSITSPASRYGIQGVPDRDNYPGGRQHALTCLDKSGRLWLYGGSGMDTSCTTGLLNDLWRYEPARGTWTWVSGGKLKNTGVTILGSGRNLTFVPGGRSEGAAWADKAGRIWIFGGTGYSIGGSSLLNDLWRFDPATQGWNNPVYDANTFSADVYPAARRAMAAWTDAQGMFWLFGGEGDYGLLNDLWRCTPDTGSGMGTWARIKGSSATNQYGTYGSQGQAAAANQPGSRENAAVCVDKAGRIWLFGGRGYGATGDADLLGDLWRFDPATGLWTWIKGSNATKQRGVYGTRGTAAPGNLPGARKEAVAWSDPQGRVYLFGGYGYGAQNGYDRLNDLWRFDPATGNWTWLAGSDQVDQLGSFGAFRVPAAGNTPGAREGATAWVDRTTRLWLFGGWGYDSQGGASDLSDLWELGPLNNAVDPAAWRSME